MRLMKLGVYNSAYLGDFYRERPGLDEERYDVQLSTLLGDFFGSSNFWTAELSKLGYETCDLVSNAFPLQRAWADENGTKWNADDWFFDVTLNQIADFRPDILLVADYSTFTAQHLRTIRAKVPAIRLIIGWCGAPPGKADALKEWDIALTCVPELVTSLMQQGLNCFHVNHAFAPRILDMIDGARAETVDFSFIGSLVSGSGFHGEREKILSHLVEHTELVIWSDLDGGRGLNPFRRTAPGRIRRRTRPALFGRRMFQQLRDSRVTLNTHIDASPNSASNMRLFEATGTGACMLTDAKANLSSLFDPESEVVAYTSPRDCVDKVVWLLANEQSRKEIAAAGQRRTLRDHTFASRAQVIDEIIKAAVAQT